MLRRHDDCGSCLADPWKLETIDFAEEIPLDLERAETVILGLRLIGGIAFEEFRQRFGIELNTLYHKQIQELEALDLLKNDGTLLRLTPRGRLLSNEAFWRFLP